MRLGTPAPVDRAEWHAAVARAAERGCVFLELLTAVDHGDSVELVLALTDEAGGSVEVLVTPLDAERPEVASIAGVLPAAAWHEREVAEMFGVGFTGHPDPRPLVLREPAGEPPLRRATPLGERLAQAWPGADTGERRRSRRQLPPGVRAQWLSEDRP